MGGKQKRDTGEGQSPFDYRIAGLLAHIRRAQPKSPGHFDLGQNWRDVVTVRDFPERVHAASATS